MKKVKKIHLVKEQNIIEGFEDCFSDVGEAGIDVQNKIVKNVCLFGTPKSSNGRVYTEKAITTIAKMAEGGKCYLDHPGNSELKERDGVRSVRDFAGVFEGAYKKGNKVFANLRAREAYFPLLQDIAMMQPRGMGLSINARVKIFSDEAGMEHVADVDLLRSTDLVSSAATTQNLWESVKENIPEVTDEEKELNDLSESAEEKIKEKFDIFVVEEGLIQNQFTNRKIRNEINDVTWIADDLIRKVLMDDKLSVADRKKKVIAVFDDLDSEVKKRIKGIKESYKMDLNTLKKDHSHLIEELFEEFKKKEDAKGIQESLDTANTTIDDLKKDIEEGEKAAEEKDQKIKDLEEENKDLKLKVDNHEVAEKLAEKKELVAKIISESDLPKDAVTDVFKEQLMELEEKKDGEEVVTVEEQAKKLIEDRKALIGKNTGKVTDSGDEFVAKINESTNDKEPKDKKDVKEAADDFMKDCKSGEVLGVWQSAKK